MDKGSCRIVFWMCVSICFFRLGSFWFSRDMGDYLVSHDFLVMALLSVVLEKLNDLEGKK